MPPGPDYAGAIAYALNRLRAELPPELTYHNVWHTEHDVMPAAVRLAGLSDLPEADVRLLEVAAAYHDIGYIETSVEHEQRGAAFAAQVLPRYGFGAERIERIAGMIMATRLPQSPRNLLEAILADADLDVLGRDDFLTRNRALRQELTVMGQVLTQREWLEMQTRLLRQHVYFTPAARALRAAGQQANLALFAAQFQLDD
jgi:uncharacterized protein